MPDSALQEKGNSKSRRAGLLVGLAVILALVGLCAYVAYTINKANAEMGQWIDEVMPYTSWCSVEADERPDVPDDYDCEAWLDRFRSEHADTYDLCYIFREDVSLFNTCMIDYGAGSTIP